jgi:DNA-binding PadR family transcriptional regulator
MLSDLTQWEAAFRKGFSKPIILQILHDEGSSYPYNLTKQIPKRTLGMLTVATSNIYPILKNLTDEGLIRELETIERKTMYGLTTKGENHLDQLKVSIRDFLTIMMKNFGKTKGERK